MAMVKSTLSDSDITYHITRFSQQEHIQRNRRGDKPEVQVHRGNKVGVWENPKFHCRRVADVFVMIGALLRQLPTTLISRNLAILILLATALNGV